MKARLFSKNIWLPAVVLVFGLFIATQVMAYELEAQVQAPAIVNSEAAPVRQGPGLEFAVVEVLSFNSVVTMLGRNADATWIYVRTASSTEGWMEVRFLNFTINPFNLPAVGSPTSTPVPNTTATSTPQAVNPVNVVGVVNTGALNVRAAPSPQGAWVDVMYFGDVMTLFGRNADGSWVFGRTPNLVDGWVNARYLNTSQPVSILPVVDNSVPSVPLTPAATVPPAVPTAVPGTAVVNTASLNVRSGPGVGYTRVTTVDQGNVVTMMGRNLDTTWIMISTANGAQGWVNGKYLTSNTNKAALGVASQTGTGHVVAGNLNIRSGAGVGFSIVTVAPYGSSLVLQGRSSDNTWLLVRAGDGKEGWANASYIATGLDINALPVLTGPVGGSGVGGGGGQPIPPANPGNTASIRSCPNLSCPASGTVYSGLTVTATGRNADSSWVFVNLSNGEQGWIQAQFVRLGVPNSTLPVISN